MSDFYRFCDECHKKVSFIRGGTGAILCTTCSKGREDKCVDCLEGVGGAQIGSGFVRCSRCHTYYCEIRQGFRHQIDMKALRLQMLSLTNDLLVFRDKKNANALNPLIKSMLGTLRVLSETLYTDMGEEEKLNLVEEIGR